MTSEYHVQFVDGVKSLKAYSDMSAKMAKEFEHLRAFIVQQENRAESMEKQLVAKKAELDAMEAKMRENRLMSDSNTKNVQDRLDKRHLELVERESKIRIKEQAIEEQLRKANALVAASEGASPKRRQTANV